MTTGSKQKKSGEGSATVWQLRVADGRDPETNAYRYKYRTVRGGVRKANQDLADFIAEVDERNGSSGRSALLGTNADILRAIDELRTTGEQTNELLRQLLKAIAVGGEI